MLTFYGLCTYLPRIVYYLPRIVYLLTPDYEPAYSLFCTYRTYPEIVYLAYVPRIVYTY